jgi:large subunit ribosomal protein L15
MPKASKPEAASVQVESTPSFLTQLKPFEGSTHRKKRVGRGRATGCGKTCSRGHNGEGQRAGQSSKRGFEGGQMPLYRRIPKFRSFPNPCRKEWVALNVGDLENLLSAGESTLTYDQFSIYSFWGQRTDGIRILGNGEIKKAITVQAHYVSPSARTKIEAAGGTIQIVEGPIEQLLNRDLAAC